MMQLEYSALTKDWKHFVGLELKVLQARYQTLTITVMLWLRGDFPFFRFTVTENEMENIALVMIQSQATLRQPRIPHNHQYHSASERTVGVSGPSRGFFVQLHILHHSLLRPCVTDLFSPLKLHLGSLLFNSLFHCLLYIRILLYCMYVFLHL